MVELSKHQHLPKTVNILAESTSLNHRYPVQDLVYLQQRTSMQRTQYNRILTLQV